MNRMPALKSYEDWKHCITMLCGIPLTGPYIEQRPAALRDPANNTTQKFAGMWGDQHRLCVIGGFEQARQEKGGTTTASAPSGQAS